VLRGMPEIRNARRPVSEGSQDGFGPVISPVAMALGFAVEDAARSGKCGPHRFDPLDEPAKLLR